MKSFKVIISLVLLFSYFPTFSQYHKNIEDEYKIYLMEKEVSDILKQSNNPEKLSQKYRNIIENYLEKDTQDNTTNFKQYALKRIYVALQYDSFLWDLSINEYHFKILENKYIKTFAREPFLYIDDTSVYAIVENDTRKIDYIVFHKVEKNTDTQDYILDNFYDEKYKWICELEELKNSNMNFFETPTYHFEEKIEDTTKWPDFKRLCVELNKWAFTRISDTVIIYIPRQFEYVGLDFRVIEIKE